MSELPSDVEELRDMVIRLGESDGFRRQQVIALSDSLAQANGELGVLRARIATLEAPVA